MEVRVDDSGRTGDAQLFTTALLDQCAKLGIAPTLRTNNPYQLPARGTVAVLFLQSGTPVDSRRATEIERFLADGGRLFPVLPKADDAAALLNGTATADVNAFIQDRYGTEWTVALVDDVLSHIWMRRRRKRIFVSYKRKDSAEIARQLFDWFNHQGYEVFLDEATIAPAENFQGRLKWWLNDADLLLLLGSPNLDSSKWVLEEIEFAQNYGIGILSLEWPDEIYRGETAFQGDLKARQAPRVLEALMSDQRRQMKLDFFAPGDPSAPPGVAGETAALTASALNLVAAWAIRQRAIGLRDRLSDLVVLTQDHLSKQQLTFSHDELGDFQFSVGGAPHLIRVVPFRPDYSVYYELAQAAEGAEIAGCLYTEPTGAIDDVQALNWCLEAARARPGAKPTPAGAGGKQLALRLWSQPGRMP